MGQRLLYLRLVHRKERLFLQTTQEDVDPQPAQADDRSKMHPVNVKLTMGERGSDQPIEINQAHDQNQADDDAQSTSPIFDVAEQQQEEGYEEVKHDQENGDHAPDSVSSRQI